ncbi:MAG: hypothetical protein ACON5I_07300 [Verrucomicrobiales bacterium]
MGRRFFVGIGIGDGEKNQSADGITGSLEVNMDSRNNLSMVKRWNFLPSGIGIVRAI